MAEVDLLLRVITEKTPTPREHTQVLTALDHLHNFC